jgi:hypothetical protein
MAWGSALNGYGGVVSISFGSSHEHSSGAIAINSTNSSFSGSSGEAEIFTGKSAVGDSGHITLDISHPQMRTRSPQVFHNYPPLVSWI